MATPTWRTQTIILFAIVKIIVSQQNCPSPCVCISTTVYCNRTGITNVPKDLPKNTVTLYLGYNPIKFIPKTAFEGLSNLTLLDFSGNLFRETSIESGALNVPSIQVLDLTSNLFMTIPRELPPNLSKIYLYYNPITTLTASSFTNHSSIQYLYLMNTQLKTIDDHAFDPLVNVIEIDIGFNKLVDGSFSPMSFVKNQMLTYLEFRFNQLMTLPDTAHFPVSLRSIDFVGNQIKTIPAFAFRTLTNLTSMELWEGAITTLADNAFYGLNKLVYLDMMQDHVTPSITNLTFNGLSSLSKLFLDLNNISKIEPGAFYPTKNIQELWLSSNRLSTLDPAVFDKKFVPQLSTIYMDDNPWICDCHLKWLREKMDKEPNVIQDPHLIVCSGPPDVAGKAWDVLQADDFKCKE